MSLYYDKRGPSINLLDILHEQYQTLDQKLEPAFDWNDTCNGRTMDGHVEHIMADKTLAKNVHLESITFTVQFWNLLAGILKKIVLLQIDGNLVTRYKHIFKQFLTNIYHLFEYAGNLGWKFRHSPIFQKVTLKFSVSLASGSKVP